jgi:hypothetical protein
MLLRIDDRRYEAQHRAEEPMPGAPNGPAPGTSRFFP